MNNKIQINAYMKFDDITQGSNLLFEIFFYIFNNINWHEYRMLRAKKGICFKSMHENIYKSIQHFKTKCMVAN